MKVKEMLIICLILCCILSFQALGAAEVNTDDTNDTALTMSDVNAVKQNNDLSSMSLPENNDVLGAGEESFTQLYDDIRDKTEVTLTKNYTYIDSDSAYVNGIPISGSIKIKGEGNIVIDASHKARIFNIADGASVTLQGITFINGNSNGNGGAITSMGVLNVIDCKFINNTATGHGGALYMGVSTGDSITNCDFKGNVAGLNGGAIDWKLSSSNGIVSGSTFDSNIANRSGGAIHWSGHYGTISNSNFTNNKAIGTCSTIIGGVLGGGDGGAVLWVGSHGIIKDNCNFVNNYAKYRGGAVFLHGNDTENCTNTTITHSYFKDNVAGLNGGAVDWQKGATNGLLSYSTFINNTAKRSGGAVFWNGYNGTIIQCSFNNNNATGENKGKDFPFATYQTTGGNGGSIIWTGALGNIKYSNFTKNSANVLGGAVYLQGSTSGSCINTTFDNCRFIENTAGSNGGAIDWYRGALNGKVLNSVFSNNTAGRSGGAIHWSGHYGIISNSNFTNNRALGTCSTIIGGVLGGGDGGAVLWVGSHGIIKDNCNFVNNYAKYRGGAVFLHGNDTENCTNTTITHSYFKDNVAGLNGGAIDWQKGATNGLLSYSTFINNTAWRSGGAVYWNGINGNISYCDFKENDAVGNVTGTDFPFATYQTDGGNGGAIIWTGAIGIIDYSNFTSNTAAKLGGAVYLQGYPNDACENTTFNWCKFTSNVAGLNGGAIDWHEGAENGNIYNSTFEHNIAKSNGGAVFWNGHNGEIYDSNFTNNTAQGLLTDVHNNRGDGGAIIWSGLNGTVYNCRFIDNNAAYRGGAVYLQNCTHGNCTNTTFSHVYFKNNTAGTNGGAIDWHEGAEDGHVLYAVFEQNTAKRSGGAIYWNGKNGEIKHSNFTDNKALGIADASDAFGIITFGGDGGAVIWIGSEGKVDDCRFIDNIAAKRGGAVYLQGNTRENCSNTNFTHSYFLNNTAGTNGGAIDWNKGAQNGIVDDVKFINNTAKRSGGAIFWNGHNGTIKNARFIGNRALGIANAIGVDGNESTGGDGGAVMWSGAVGTVYNSNFINNTAALHGGAVFLQGSESEPCENTTFKYNYFANNIAGGNGGAIDWYIGASRGNLQHSKFINNTAKRSGGAVYWNGQDGNITNCTFNINHALGTATNIEGPYTTVGGNGGAMTLIGTHIFVNNCTCTANEARYMGGAIHLQRSTNSTISSSYFYDNIAGTNGGAVNWYLDASNGILSYNYFENNTAKRSGGAFAWEGYNGTVIHSKFFNNRATGEALEYNMALKDENVIIVNKNETAFLATAPTESDVGKLYALNYTVAGGREFKSYVADRTDEGLVWLKLDETFVNIETISPKDWAIDQFFGGDGGTIVWSGDVGLVYNCTIIESNSARRGGGAYMTGSDNVTFKNCYFENDTSGTNGGGVDWLAGANYGKIYNCTFNNTRAARSAGAIYYDGWYGDMQNVTIINTKAWGGSLKESKDKRVKYAGWDSSHWDTNTTGGDAGAIMFTGNHEYLHNVTFINCTATGRGGAVFLQDNKNVTFDLCTFKNNRALGTANNTWNDDKDLSSGLNKWKTGMGGAIAFDVGATQGYIYNSKFINNTAVRIGGAINFGEGSSQGHVNNSLFENNTAYRSGGAISIDGINNDVSWSNFTNNAALGTDIDSSLFSLTSLSQIVNVTSISQMTDSSKLYVLVKYNEITHKKESYELYLLMNGVPVRLESTTEVGPSPIDFAMDEYFGGDGGTIFWRGDNGTVDHCNFINSNSARRGGGAYMTGCDNITFKNTNFIKCTSGTNGGGVDWLAGANYGKVINCTFNNTRAARSAGAIYYDGDYGRMENITIINATNYGGTLKTSDDGRVKYAGWDSSHWDTNTTGGDAGAIMFTGDHEYVYNATFINCISQGRGGAVFLQDNVNVTFELCTFKNNQALGVATNTWSDYKSERNDSKIDTKIDYKLTGHGGAVAFDVGAQNCTFINSEFIHNYARRDGGAINFAEGSINNTIKNSNFTNNYAGDDGGAINWEGNFGYVDNIICYNNTGIGFNDPVTGASTSKGGTICLTGSNVTISNSEFTLGTVYYNKGKLYETDAGALFITGNNNTILNSTFNKCYSPNSAGAIKVIGNHTTIDNCTFTNCNATEDGGALEVLGQYCELSNSIFKRNFAGDDGGAINWEGNHGKIFNITCSINNGLSLNKASSNGGTICLTGSNVTVDKSRFNMTSAKISGGAIFVTGNYVHIHNSDFAMCNVSLTEKAPSGKGYTTGGGSIYVLGNSSCIENCTFDRSNGKEGGVLYIQGKDAKVTNITTTHTFAVNGGAVYIEGVNATILDSNISLTNATVAGGAIYIHGVDAKVFNSTFSKTTAKSASGFANNNFGGAIYIRGNNANISGSDFELGSAYTGGMLYLEGSYSYIYNSTFDKSHATQFGGVIYSTGSYSKVIKSNFTDNIADGCGGAIYWHGGYNSKYNDIDSCLFLNNTVYGTNSPLVTRGGGAIYYSRDGSFCSITNSNFTNNSVQYTGNKEAEGGAVLWDYSSACTVDNCIFDGNYIYSQNVGQNVWIQGGAFYIRCHNVTINRSTFVNCWTSKEAGALYLSTNSAPGNISDPWDILVNNSVFINNTAKSEGPAGEGISSSNGGGAIQTKESPAGKIAIINSNFTNNTAYRGGALTVASDTKGNFIINCTFVANNATWRGGSIYSAYSVNLHNISIYNSTAAEYGGGAYLKNVKEYSNFTIVNNHAVSGGGLYWDQGGLKIKGFTFINNTAEDKGGAIYLPTGSQTITYNNFTGNAANYGGALYVINSYTINNNNFANNSAITDGGAIYISSGGSTITFNNYTGNSAQHGGAIYSPVSEISVKISDSLFTSNHAYLEGGAIYAGYKGDSNKPIYRCKFVNNTADQNGGAIYIANNGYKIDSCDFNGNNATLSGGAIYIYPALTGIEIKDSTFENSNANNGGGIYYGGSDSLGVTIRNDTFRHNTAFYNGGAVLYRVFGVDATVYRDYDNFDKRGVISQSTGRTDVTSTGSSNTHFIITSLFENNVDYPLIIQTTSDLLTPVITVNLKNPRRVDPNSINFVVNLTNDAGELIKQINITPENYYSHYNPVLDLISINFDGLEINQKYNITVGFADNNYLYKENTTQELTHGNLLGDFTLLQMLIEQAIANQQDADFYEFNLTRSYRFTEYANGLWLDKKCMNLTNIDKPFIIHGNGWALDARGFSRIFNVTASNVTFDNVLFVNGNASGKYGDGVNKGGAIFWAGTAGVLNNCIVEDNNAALGGGIYFKSTATNARISNSQFIRNNATLNGGAIECNATRMNLTNTVFDSNYAGEYGAALCREANATGGFGYNNRFIANHAEIAGAALAWMKAQNIYINKYDFINNTVGYSGGAIYVGQGSTNCTIAHSYFYGNNVTDPENGHGGAVEWYSDYGQIIDSTFVNNNAYTGGAVYVGSESGHINITQSEFVNNTAITVGGAIDLVASTVNINDTIFKDNKAKEGGAVYVGGNGQNNVIDASYFLNNIATDGNGGAINWNASSGRITNTNFTHNMATYGGALYLGGLSAESSLVNCIFYNNHAKLDGGAIECNVSRMNLKDTLFDSNYGRYGAALCREPNAIGGSGSNNTFRNNHAYIAGAALGWMGSQKITITNYTFVNNSADISGGAIYVGPSSHNCTIITSNFIDNYVTYADSDSWRGQHDWIAWDGTPMTYIALPTNNLDLINKTIITDTIVTYYFSYNDKLDVIGRGGAIECLAENATINKSYFRSNEARLGGALYVGAEGGNTLIKDSVFRNNNATERGGAVNLHASAVHVDDSEFYDNIAVNGSALYVGGVGTDNKVHGSVFDGNNATGYGAGIYWKASAGEINDTVFVSNRATYGGGIYLNGISANTNLTHLTFKYNNATKNGGAIDCNSSNMGLYDTTFISNYAGEYGAALCREADATNGHGKNNTFISNHADIAGAALAWLGVKGIHINNYTFTDNTADYCGGAIYVGEGSDNCVVFNSTFTGNHITNMSLDHNGGAIACIADNLTVNESSFTNNGAYNGGAIYVGTNSSQVTVQKSNFTKNYAEGNGGAIGLRASSLSIDESRFISNTAEISGGAVYVAGNGTANKIHNALFESNTAGDHGGAIDWIAQAGEIVNSNFTKNTAVYGGGIYLNGVSSQSKISNVIFDSNDASKNGGAIDCNATMMNLTHTLFKNNHAGEYGAALCREANATGGFGVNNTFISNHADISGAALAWLGVDNININNYTFINNTAYSSGGAIYVSHHSDYCKVRNSTFENNYVTDVRNGRGGAIDWIGHDGLIADSTFKDSFAVNGGTVYVDHGSDNLTVDNVTFIASRAMGDGGAIALYSDNAVIKNSNFTFALALESGGAISGHGADNATIVNCTFDHGMGAGYIDSSLKAYGEGGAIYWENANELNISNSKFINLRSNSNGGAISAIDCNNSVLYNLTFNNQFSSNDGGSVSWIDSTNITIDNCKFDRSEAYDNGGALYLDGINDTIIKNSEFATTRTPWGNGGAIYVKGNVTIENDTFTDYDANEGNAAGIFFHSGNSSVANSSFVGPDAIWVNKTATVSFTGNNITGPLPNRDVYYLNEPYNARYNKYDYSIWNDGTISLDKNNFSYIIFNNGTITSHVTIKMLNNESYEIGWNEFFEFFANVTDDNLNTIISVDSLITYNDVFQDAPNHYPLSYNYIGLDAKYQGVFHLTASDSGLPNRTVYSGTLKVKMPVSIEFETPIITDDYVIIKASITPKVRSNYTISNEDLIFKLGDKEYKGVISASEEQITDGEGNVFITWDIARTNVNITDLMSQTHKVTAIYNGDDVHFSSEEIYDLVMPLRKTWVRIYIENYTWGRYGVANITSNGNGTVLISFNGRSKEYALVNGTFNLTFDEILDPGLHYMSVYYLEDDYYANALNTTEFEVYWVNTAVEAHPTNISYGENEIIDVYVNQTATGYIVMTIGTTKYLLPIDNGTVKFNISGLAAGKYENIPVVYGGDTHFLRNTTYINFTVNATKKYDMDVKVDNIVYGENATVRILLPTQASGNVSVYIDGVFKGNVSVASGVAVLSNIAGLTGGEHEVNVTYHGDDSYAAKDFNGTKFNVNPYTDWKMGITITERPYGENTTIFVSVDPKYQLSNENVTLTIGGVKYNVTLKDGEGNLTLNNLSAGVYISNAYYAGDDNYSNKTQIFRVEIAKATPSVIITRENGDVIATVSGNATGNVTFYINGVKYENVTVGGKAVIRDILRIGENNIIASYDGDNNYNRNYNVTNFEISRHTTNLTVSATPVSVVVGNNVTITVNMVNVTIGKVLIEIGNYNYTVNIVDGVAKLNLTLPVGDYSVKAYYLGDVEHDSCNGTGNDFHVIDKLTPEITIVAPSEAKVGQTINISVSSNGYNLTVWINGVQQTIVDGNISYTVTSAGIKTIYAETTENETVYAVNKTSVFEAIKNNATLNIHEIGVVLIGDEITITIGNITDGSLTVKVDGVVITDNKFTPTASGNYTITVESSETIRYYAGFNSTVFNVVKRNSAVNVTANSIYVNGEVIINITAPNDIDGIVKVCVNNMSYTVNIVNGNGSLKLSGLANGTYNVNVTYIENDRYFSSINNTSFNVSKLATEITIDVENITYGGIAQIEITVPGVDLGVINVKINNSAPIELTVRNGKAYWNVSDLNAGKYSITVVFDGNGYYNESKATKNFTVDKATAYLNILRAYANISDVPIIHVMIINTDKATGNITINVNNHNYTSDINTAEGYALFIIDPIYVGGDYIVTAWYNGDDNFKNTTRPYPIGHLIVGKTSNYEINVAATETLAGENSTITVYVPSDATGNVTIWVNGTKLNTTVNSGKAVFNVTKDKVGLYTVNATLTDIKYADKTAITKYRVFAVDTPISIVVSDIHVGDIAEIIVTVPNGTVNNVTIEINGNSYTNVTVNGNATFYIVDLTAGNKTVVASYMGDEKYAANFTTENFTVSKNSARVNITVGERYEIGTDFSIVIGNDTDVVVTVNGIEYPVVNGKVDIDTTKLAAGNYTVTATVYESGKYLANSTTKEFVVYRHASVIDSVVVPDVNVVVGKNATITVTMGNVTSGSIIIEVGSYNYTVDINSSGVATLVVALPVGNYAVHAYYLESDKYNATDKVGAAFNVTAKQNATVIINAGEVVEIDGKLVFNVTNSTPVVVTINDVVITPVNGNYTFDANVAGNYTIVARSVETDMYYAGFNSTTFKVIKHNSTVNITVNNVYEIESEFNITIGNNTVVNVTINGKVYSVVNGKVVIDTTKLAAGNYTVTATVYESDKYLANSTSKTFTIFKHNATITSIIVPDVKVGVGKNATITLTMGNVTSGSLLIEVNGYNYTVDISDSVAELNVTLPIGKYHARAYFLGDNKYNAVTSVLSEEFTIADKGIVSINITAPSEVEVDNNIIFTVTNSTPVNVTVNGVKVELKDGKYTYNVTKAGIATIVVTSVETNELYAGYNSTTVTVLKHNSTVSIDEVNPHFVGDNFTITVHNNTAVVVTVNGKEYAVKDGKVVIDTTKLTAGEYIVTAFIKENDKYLENSSSITFNITKRNSSINITVNDKYEIGTDFDIGIENSTVVNVTINGVEYPVVNGKVVIDTAKLAAGNYTIIATIYESDKYFANVTTEVFEIVKHESEIKSIVVPNSDTTVGKNVTITVTMGNVTSGSVIIEVGGHNYTVDIVDKVAILNVTLPEGNYKATAYFLDDDNYTAATLGNASEFSVVAKQAATVIINAGEVVEIDGKLVFNVTNSTPVVVTINGKVYTPVNGNYTFEASEVGNYTIVVRSAETDEYLAGFNTTTFKVIKHNATVNVTVAPTHYVEDSFDIEVFNNNTIVNLTINGKEYAVKDGKVVIDTAKLTAGHYIVTATVKESDKYDGVVVTKEFDIIKHASTVNVTAPPIDVGKLAIIDITAPNYNGTAVVEIKGVTYSVTITNGVGQLKVSGLGNGTYDVNVTYLENDKYLSSVNNTSKLVVSKVIPDIHASYDNITLGQNAVFEITLPSDATGTVTIKLNNTEIIVGVTGGANRVVVDNLTIGTYNVNITYNGNDKYLTNSTGFTLKVGPATIKDGITVEDLRNGTVLVYVPENATGNVSIKIGENIYNATIKDGKAIVDLVNETPGTYDALVTYSGDENHTEVKLDAVVKIDKYVTPISIEVNSTVVGNITRIIVTVDGNVTNNVTIEIDGVKYNKTVTEGKAIFEIENLTAGVKTVVASYAGDDSYLANATTEQFTINKLNSCINVTDVEIDVGKPAIIDITAPNYNGTARVTINNESYFVEITNGVGQLKVYDLSEGSYDVNVTYIENDKYYSSENNTAKVIVSKITSSVIVKVDNITVGDVAVVNITVINGAIGNVTIKIGNEYTQTVGVTDGVISVVVPGLTVGNKVVNVTYNGDDKYLSSNNTCAFTVKNATASINLVVVNITQSQTETITVFVNATGNVTIKLGDEVLDTVDIVEGKVVYSISRDLDLGPHTVEVIYNGNEKTDSVSTKANFTVSRNPVKTNVTVDVEVDSSMKVGETQIINITVNDTSVNGEVIVNIDGKNSTVVLKDGRGNFTTPVLKSGNHTVTIIYEGDETFAGNWTSKTIEVTKLNAPMSVSAEVNGGEATIKLSDLPTDATGYVIIDINGTEYGINLTNTREITIPILKSGKFNVKATYLGDDKYLSNISKTTFEAQKTSSEIDVQVNNTVVGNDLVVKVTVPKDGNGTVKVTVANITKEVPVNGGENTIPISGVGEGTHDVTVEYSGNEKYDSKTVVKTVTVFKSINSKDQMSRGWNSPYDFQAEFLDKNGNVLKNTDVQFIVNGKTYNVKTDNQGIAYLTDSHLGVGSYEITAVNPVTGEKTTSKVTIVKRLIENKDITMDFVDGTYYVVRAIGDDGKPVEAGEFVDIYVNTIHYSCKTDKNGYAKLKINLNPKKYTVVAEYKNTKVTNKLVVKQTLKLVKKTVSVKKGKNLVLKVALKWSNGKAIKGKVIKVKFNGKTYKAKTDSKGIAKVTIKSKITKKLKKGKKYAYAATYLTNTIKGKVSVK